MLEQEKFIKELCKHAHIPNSQMTLGEFDISIKLVPAENLSQVLVQLPFPIKGHYNALLYSIKDSLQDQCSQVDISLQSKIRAKKVHTGISLLPNIKNIIAIASGKGGVGKSTTVASLAIELNRMGAKVGVLDADLYGPSQTLMMGVRTQKSQQKENYFMPVVNQLGIEVMSMGFLIDDNQAVVWRGPMMSKALQQLLFFTRWGELDYLIVDLPPGTGDIQLTLAQKIPVTAALVVTTPQEIALIDAQKAITMFANVSIPVIGIIENMSHHICTQCHFKEEIFASGGGEKLAQSTKIKLLGQIPLAYEIREAMDTGNIESLHKYSKLYQDIAWALVLDLARMTNDYSHHFPNIAVNSDSIKLS